MIVPQYWAEARIQVRRAGKQVTVRRFGWSDASQEAAQAHAESRAQEAMQRIQAGESRLARREPKVPYHGAEGVPIREEIVGRHGDTVITRNSYGARCLNTPDVLFADIDFEPERMLRFWISIVLFLFGWYFISIFFAVFSAIMALLIDWGILVYQRRMREDPAVVARKRIQKFLVDHSDWRVRLYLTPAGMRVIVMHRTFSPDDPDVEAFFRAIGTDELYRIMCRNQKCFRARLSAKPWRIGIQNRMRPRPGVWPVNPLRLPDRLAWVEQYDERAQGFAACRFIEEIGEGATDEKAQSVQLLHDELSKANEDLPIA